VMPSHRPTLHSVAALEEQVMPGGYFGRRGEPLLRRSHLQLHSPHPELGRFSRLRAAEGIRAG